MKIQESAENYLETILVLHKRKGAVRSIDIANEMNFSKPSVSVAMKNLRQGGYVKVDDDGSTVSYTHLSKGTRASPPHMAQVAVKYSRGPRAAFLRASRQGLQRCGSFWKPRSA